MAPNQCPLHYAAIVRSGKILSVGASGLAGCSRLTHNVVTRHAEMDAICKVSKVSQVICSQSKRRLRNASVWSVRWKCDKNGTFVLANAKPCKACKEVALKIGIRTVYYSNEHGIICKENLIDLDTKYTPATVIHMRSNRGYTGLTYKDKS
jgi:deoxycytidylate deaminase